MKAVELRRLAHAIGKTLQKAGEPLDTLGAFAVLFRDRPLLVAILLWGVTVVAILVLERPLAP